MINHKYEIQAKVKAGVEITTTHQVPCLLQRMPQAPAPHQQLGREGCPGREVPKRRWLAVSGCRQCAHVHMSSCHG